MVKGGINFLNNKKGFELSGKTLLYLFLVILSIFIFGLVMFNTYHKIFG